MLLQIRNMESNTGISLIKDALSRLGLHFNTMELVEVNLNKNISSEKSPVDNIASENAKPDLVEEEKRRHVENIKAAIIQLLNFPIDRVKPDLSDYISQKLNDDYLTLNNLFSEIEGITIEKHFLEQKIERVKELLKYSELSVGDIATKLDFESESQLLKLFEKLTGFTPASYKELRTTTRYKSREERNVKIQSLTVKEPTD